MILKLKEYERIYKVINSVIKNEGADPTVSCILFSIYGAHILSQHYKLNAISKAGLAAYNVAGANEIILFGEEYNGNFVGNNEAFHCWIEVDGWVIDFMAPTFSDIHRKTNSLHTVDVNMFQKPLSKMSSSAHDLTQKGDFYLESDPNITSQKIAFIKDKVVYSDLADICSQWFTKPPKKILKTILVGNAKREFNQVSLIGKTITGTW